MGKFDVEKIKNFTCGEVKAWTDQIKADQNISKLLKEQKEKEKREKIKNEILKEVFK